MFSMYLRLVLQFVLSGALIVISMVQLAFQEYHKNLNLPLSTISLWISFITTDFHFTTNAKIFRTLT
ncbi:Uncharacterized protein TCM_021666 [Theobroma cacao]|uniref:Uncharacterized protein n=1 Tax=Theobroma cacao TaxID=3641 RepID=A0A061EQQ7_THECC|nr:Uncharacterized protein TCM_021666 [Theobroma cacao]